MKIVAVVGALDTKGEENQYLINQLESEGLQCKVINVGVLGKPFFKPDISSSEVASVGGGNLRELKEIKDRAKSVRIMAKGAAKIVKQLYDEKKIHGVISMGGGQGTAIGAEVMRALPIGAAKVLISTLATIEGQQKPFEDINDTMIMSSLVDIAGLNNIMRLVIKKAAATIASLVRIPIEKSNKNIHIGASMYGITTPCVDRVKKILEKNGYEVFVFHATGMGGRVMESLIYDGYIQGIADITLGEITHEIVGGIGSAGPTRLEAAGAVGIPQIICPGGLDVINFMPPESVPKKYKKRKFTMHNPNLKVIRTSVEENKRIGNAIAKKLNKSKGETVVIIPLKGISENDKKGKVFYGPDEDKALFETIKSQLNSDIEVIEMNSHINDKKFAFKVAELLMRMIPIK